MESRNTYEKLDEIVEKLKSSNDPKRKYEYILWLGKKLGSPSEGLITSENKVKGCVSEVFVRGNLVEGKIYWEGYSDALITKGLLSFLVIGLNALSPTDIVELKKDFIDETGLNKSLTPSRSNGFLNILLKMKAQANSFLSSQ